MDNRPRGREKNITGQGKEIQKHGSGLNSGPVGRSEGYEGRPQSPNGQQGQQFRTENPNARRQTTTRAGGRGGFLIVVIIVALVLFGGKGLMNGLTGGVSDSGSSGGSSWSSGTGSSGGSSGWSGGTGSSAGSTSGSSGSAWTSSGSASSSAGVGYGDLFGGSLGSGWLSGGYSGGSVSSGWTQTANTGRLDTTVASGARAKRTQILGGGRDTVTIMVYMCGADLESRSAMGSKDLQEMLDAGVGSGVNLIIYTGGCKNWQNNMVSSSVNQIYQIQGNRIRCLVDNDGTDAMTRPATLSRFIRYCAKNFPANRNELIFWDHGGGSLSGYGYDEKNTSAGSMTLKGIDEALKDGGVTFDFIGFDACLMATLENALMLDSYADYLIASEETEPGVGWYYTDWLKKLSANTSMSTLEIGRNIVDDFVNTCNQKCAGQKTTLSVVDLAELSATVPQRLKEFAADTCEMLRSDQYQTVSDARSNTREFAASTRIDQVDLVHLVTNMGTEEGRALADAVLGAVKYNRTSSGITNAYGLSIYFPYQKTYKVDSAVATYQAIGMDSDYMRCIQQFASMETGGQAASGGAASPYGTLFGTGAPTGGASAYGGQMSQDSLYSLLSGLMGGNYAGVYGLDGSNSGYLGRGLDPERDAAYLADHQFDASRLVWTRVNGVTQLILPEEQWGMVHELLLSVFYDDGMGYIDLGLDNVFRFSAEGGLVGEFDGTWLAIDDQPVAYYYEDSVYDGDYYAITGRVPVLLNGERANLILVFDSENPYGYIAGARYDYVNGETETVAKGVTELTEGDRIQFVCDYYRYDGTYENSYRLGEEWSYTGDHRISNVYIEGRRALAAYLFVDLYCQEYWTPAIP